jgi:hypothetical protein
VASTEDEQPARDFSEVAWSVDAFVLPNSAMDMISAELLQPRETSSGLSRGRHREALDEDISAAGLLAGFCDPTAPLDEYDGIAARAR